MRYGPSKAAMTGQCKLPLRKNELYRLRNMTVVGTSRHFTGRYWSNGGHRLRRTELD
jgi:hypothetical protein